MRSGTWVGNMSLEAYVLSNKTLQTYVEWQRHIDALAFDLTLIGESEPPARRGHLPAVWNGREAGFECGPGDLDDIVTTYDDVEFGGPWTYAYAFCWSTLSGCLGAWMAATAYARATGGVVFDPQEGVIQTVEDAVRETRDTERNFPRIEAMFEA